MKKSVSFNKLFLLIVIYCFFGNSAFSQTIIQSISKGLENSKSLAGASLEWAAINEKKNQAYAGRELQGILNGSFSESLTGTSGSYNDSFSNSITATLKKTLYDGGVSEIGSLIGRLKLEQKSLQIKTLEQNVILDAIDAHLKVFLTKKIRQLREKNILRVKEQVEANKARYDVGAINKTILAVSEARLARANSQVIEARIDLMNAVELYISLIGETPGEILIPEINLDLPNTVQEAASRAEMSSMNIALAKLNLSLNQAEYESLIASVMPNLSTSLAGSISETTKTGNSEGIKLSLTLTSPIFYTPATSSKNRELVASSKALSIDLEEAIRRTKLNAKTRFNILNSSLSIIKASEVELKAAQVAAEGIKKENEFGAKTILDVLDAEMDVLDAEINILKARTNSAQSAFSLLAALGELKTEELGIDLVAPQYKMIEIIAPPLPSPLSILRLKKWKK